MRLARYVLAEIAVAVVGFGVLAAGAFWLVGALGDSPAHTTERPVSWRTDLDVPPAPQVASEPAGTFLGMADDLLLARMRAQPITRLKLNKGGSSLSFRVDFADGSRAAFKPAQTNLQTIPRKEVAAYRINRLLGLTGVPPAAPRLVSREELFSHLHPDNAGAVPRIRAETIFNPDGYTSGVASYWIPVIKDSGLDESPGREQGIEWLTLGSTIPKRSRSLAAQLSDLMVFDFLICNPDRHSGGNMKMSADGMRLFYMDNTLAFFLPPECNEKTHANLIRTQRFSRRLFGALDRLTVRAVERALAESGLPANEILTPAEVRAVLARRDIVKQHVSALVQAHGDPAVFAFP